MINNKLLLFLEATDGDDAGEPGEGQVETPESGGTLFRRARGYTTRRPGSSGALQRSPVRKVGSQ
jgi:hypothetical protein